MTIEHSMDQVFIKKVTDILEANLANEQFGVKELIYEMGISRSKLHRKLNVLTQKSTSQFIREYRLEKAMEMLQNDVATASEIAYRVGFNSPTYFNTCFHQYFGFPPGEVKFRNPPVIEKSEAEETKQPALHDQDNSVTSSIDKISSRQRMLLLFSLGLLLIIAFSYYYYFSSKEMMTTKTTETVITDKSIAIIPFKYLSNEKEDEYFAVGVMGSIHNHLSKIKGLKVISEKSMEKYADTIMTASEIANEIGVSYLLDGSVQKIGDSIRIIAHLINANSNQQLTSMIFDWEYKNIFTLQSKIAMQIAEELGITISSTELEQIEKKPTEIIEAYDYYLKGVNYLNEGFLHVTNFRYAFKMFEKAVEIDPDFTLAWVGLASASRCMYWFYIDRSTNRLQQTKLYLDRAIIIDPDLMEVRLEIAWYYFHCVLNYPKALKILKKIKSDYPNNAQVHALIGWIYRRMGEFEIFMEQMKQAISLDPSNWLYWYSAGETLIALGRYTDAEESFKTAIDLNPSNTNNYDQLIVSYLCAGKVSKAKKLIENNPNINSTWIYLIRNHIELIYRNYDEAIRILESSPNEVFSGHRDFLPKSLRLARIYNMKSDSNLAKRHFLKAKQILEKKLIDSPEDSRVYSSLGITYAGLGMDEEAVAANNKALTLMNLSIDSWRGFQRELDMAKILMMIGKKNEAIDKLEFLLQKNGYISVELLKNEPFWDPLRHIDSFNNLIRNPKYQVNFVNN